VPRTVILALGSNLGDRRYNLLRALHALGPFVRVVRLSSIHETEPVDAPAGSPPFLNMVIAGYTDLSAYALLDRLLAIEAAMGRVRRGVRNAPRPIDLDLIRYSGEVIRTTRLTVPHPRYRERDFVLVPMREIGAASQPSSAFGTFSRRAGEGPRLDTQR
jgi:2-amino-4-hydroxy-6-hydroxymethyldihydropteridine diphosphokinase